ncbi:glycerophosphodiester phosphodiesterase family protein [Marinilongibacter aquaticus]|uniref:glycerophosphodiester phosphodiesterase family protein n=1 Tax=Marinilongibacter aquaticus TaxID=2975157 RepID=UPI0021BD5CA9|nr:glycerophosphodiester phosphodiesterase family protein [Marinilongibacter aquaticus]UBM58624.1 glycerophosphodiester phosphodiesterase family protein [Marinilongibacter aquaticus]
MKKNGILFLGFLCFAQMLWAQNTSMRIQDLRANLDDSHNDQVIVVAHRGDWRNAPENSLQAIQNCIDMGVDMVEIDVQETKDGHLVLMHDSKIDRTTKAKGYVRDWTLDSLKTLYLIDGLGHVTPNRIPTLEEALEVCKGKILVNLDKSYSIFDKCYAVAKSTGTLDQVVIKGAKSYAEVKREFGQYLDKVYFMPIVRLKDENAEEIVNGYLEQSVPVAFEFTVPADTVALIQKFAEIREKGASVWVNSLWANQNGGHDDEKAVLDNKVYDWFIQNHIDIIQTDRPKILIDYLRKNGLHK